MAGRITFNAGPYRRWTLELKAFGQYGTDDGTGRILVHVEPPYRDGQPPADRQVRLWLAHGNPGYEVALDGVNNTGRAPMERVLDWTLDHLAELLADPDGVAPDLRGRVLALVNEGHQARDDFRAMWGDGPESPFQVVAAFVIPAGRQAC